MKPHRTAAQAGRAFAQGFDPRRNAGGRPVLPAEVKAAFRELTPEAVQKVKALMQSKDERIQLEATRYALDRAWGRPTERVAGDHDEAPVRFESLSPAQFAELAQLELAHRLLRERTSTRPGAQEVDSPLSRKNKQSPQARKLPARQAGTTLEKA